jgi:hypothetical protein
MLSNESWLNKGLHGPEVEAVAGAPGRHPADKRRAKKGQVADKVQNLMPDKLIWKAEGRVDDAPLVEHNRIL